MKNKLIIITTGLLALLASCSSPHKEYYFDLDHFSTPKVYKFECESNPELTEYWKLSASLDTETLFLEMFDVNFNLIYTFKEKYLDEGSELIEFKSMILDEDGNDIEVNRNPISKNVFKWDCGEPFYYEVEQTFPGAEKSTLKKERLLLSEEDIQIMGHKYSTVKFEDKFTFQTDGQNTESSQYSYYAKGLGCVKMIYIFGKEEYSVVLTDIIEDSEWQQML